MIALVLVATACSKGLSLQEYFTKIGNIQKEFEDQSSALQKQAQSSTATDDASVLAEIKGFMGSTVDLTSKTKSELDGLKPPSEAEAANAAFVTAFGNLLTALKEAQTAVGSAGTVNEAVAALGSEKLKTASAALDKACTDLSNIAKASKVTTTLHCNDPNAAAQSSLRNSLAAAKTLFTDTDDYSGISVEAMAQIEPSLNYVDGSIASTGATEISIYTNGSNVYAAAALSDSGTCLYVKDDATTGTTYGTGPGSACTGQDAADSATAASW